jgi:glycerol-3-phosphate dehydrogenase
VTGGSDALYDLLVVGGGINGAGLARDAAGRGLKVLLVEKDDLGQGTSSRSSKLIHGGLRYLEFGEFRLVRESLIEREVLLRAAPHIVQPMRFVLPHAPKQRAAFLVRTGLFLYDHLGGRERLPGTRVSTFGATRKARRSRTSSGAASCIPIAGPMMLASSSSTRWMRRGGAR